MFKKNKIVNMLRQVIDTLKFPEGIRVPILGGLWYNLLLKLDNLAIRKAKLSENMLNCEKRETVIICSLTSYPARISYVYYAIKSILLQTCCPDRVILWLAEEQFPTKELPDDLLSLVHHGLEIKWTHDMYGHKKYYYPVKEQKSNEVVITFDDDIIYSPRCIERLMKVHKKFPDCLVCERGQVFIDKKEYNPGRWKTISTIGTKEPTFSMNPSPGGGCLIPYGAFYKDAVNEECFTSLAYKNDDLWYMFMCAENGTRMIKTRKFHRSFSVVTGSQVEQMATENVVGDRNINIMDGLMKAYPTAWHRILSDKE